MMATEDVQTLIRWIAEVWPHQPFTEGEVRLWRGDLERMEAVVAADALDDLRATEEFRPSWAKFRAAYQARLRRVQHDDRPALEEAVVPRPESARRWAAVHAFIVRRRYLAHDHRDGPHSCPICSRHKHHGGTHPTAGCARCEEVTEQVTFQ